MPVRHGHPTGRGRVGRGTEPTGFWSIKIKRAIVVCLLHPSLAGDASDSEFHFGNVFDTQFHEGLQWFSPTSLAEVQRLYLEIDKDLVVSTFQGRL